MISFVGAGPGDLDLITVKGRKLLQEADMVIYAGSLVDNRHLEFCKETVEAYDSAKLHLDQVIDLMEKGAKEGKKIVRLHTGDPTIYGAIKEQMDRLDKLGLEYQVIPGVSSAMAACASIKREFTLPDVSQTVILTRNAGRTPVPEEESLEKLASHKASMAIFLSVQDIDGVVEKLIKGYGNEDTPIAVVYRATWEDQEIVMGTLKDIAEKVKAKGIKKQAQILVGDFIDSAYSLSKLYDKTFTTEYRKGI